MKLKEIDRTANVAWSPASQHPIYLAAGTAAQQLDATFSTSSSLELYTLNLAEPGQDMEIAGTLSTESRLHKLVWGPHGVDDQTSSGLLIGGAEQGRLYIWDPAKILSEEDPLVHLLDKHTGAVAALDINPFQANLLASGAGDSEIYIWDLGNPDKPMTPGSKSQPQHDVSCVAWNRQVQHILASSSAGNCVVWDLRKNEPIIKIRDSMSRIKCNVICWHPDVATQMCLASEDDHAPVIQIWDLRSATSPVRLLENHKRGILSMAWCPNDSDLLLSCGKDNRILCWNPNSDVPSGEVVYELPTSNQWCFDVQWCPRNPAVISGCSFDGHISVYSIMGGTPPTETSSKVADAFAVDSFSQPVPHHAVQEQPETMLKKAPKWMRRPCGASFTFGGKLVTFANVKTATGPQATYPEVNISQVVTEKVLLERSVALENTLNSGHLSNFCDAKIAVSVDKSESDIWHFLKVNFDENPRNHYLKLLGYDQTEVRNKLATVFHGKKEENGTTEEDADDLEVKNSLKDEGSSVFDDFVQNLDSTSLDDSTLSINVGTDCDGLITESLLTANFDAAVEVCLQHKKLAEAMILAIAGGSELLMKTQRQILQTHKSGLNQLILAIVMRDFESVVRNCDLSNWKEALAIILTYADGKDFVALCNLLGSRLENEGDESQETSAHLCYIVAGNVEQLVASWNKSASKINSHLSLQDLIEKVMVLQRSVESSSIQPNIAGGHLATSLTEYAKVLGEQGYASTALNYLGASEELSIAVLRDRLFWSLGYEFTPGMQVPQKPFKVVNVLPEIVKHPVIEPVQPRSQPRSRTTSGANYYPNQPAVQPAVPQSNQFPNYPDYSPNIGFQPNSNYFDSNGQSNNYAPSAPAAPVQAPSTKKGPLGKYHYPQQQPAQQPQPVIRPYDPYSQPDASPAPFPAYSEPTPNTYNPIPAAQAYTPGAPYMPSNEIPSYQVTKPVKAWNDPPDTQPTGKLNRRIHSDHAPGGPRFEGQIYNPQEYQMQLQQQQQQLHQQQHQLHQQHQQQYQQQHQQQLQHQQNPAYQQPVQQPTEQVVQVLPVAKAVAAQPLVRKTLPEEHQVIRDVLDRLVELCLEKAHNPPTRKKLDDVVKKLEVLYDRICTGSLSQPTINGLHQIVLAIQQYDYNSALTHYSQIVSHGSFSEISSFIPGIKVLMQTASQMQVYIQ